MLNKSQHKVVLIKILKEIYSDPEIATSLGFKGGTAAYLFYDLPRFSVDLDFDLLNENKKQTVSEKISNVLKQLGNVSQADDKRFTLFFLLNYEKGQRNVKVEISKRTTITKFEVKHYLGIPVLVASQDNMAAGKLSALLTRKKFASRDIFDLWFFLKNDWAINEEHLKKQTGLNLQEAVNTAIDKISKIENKQLLHGIGELVDEKQKYWIKNKLKDEVIFYLKLYLEKL